MARPLQAYYRKNSSNSENEVSPTVQEYEIYNNLETKRDIEFSSVQIVKYGNL
jgi:hypothetical protein